MANRMVWPHSLSRDRKWPRPPIRRKTTPWPRVTPVASLEQSIMGRKCVSASSASILPYEQNFLIFSTIFRKNTRNSLFRQRKTSIGNNSGFIKTEPWSLPIVVRFSFFVNGSSNGVTAIYVTWPKVTTPTDSAKNNTLTACDSGSIHARTVDNGPENVFRHHLHQFCRTNEKV